MIEYARLDAIIELWANYCYISDKLFSFVDFLKIVRIQPRSLAYGAKLLTLIYILNTYFLS